MSVSGVLLLCLWLGVIPWLIGEIFINVDKQAKKLPFRWMSGQLILWAGFQFVCEPFVLLQKEFTNVKMLFLGYQAVLVLLAVLHYFLRKKKGRPAAAAEKPFKRSKGEYLAWGIFTALLLFQLIQAVRMTYADIDDAYYVALSTSTWDSDTMYQKIPYTGAQSGLNLRHGLAPFPMWITFLSVMSGIRPVIVAHVAVPIALITMTYGIFYLLGEKIFAEKRKLLPLFLIFTELLVLFGDYSIYTAEKFMIARSRQGKSALGSIIVPALFLLFMILLDKFKEEKKLPVGLFVLIGAAMTTSCLCSALGGLLTCVLVGVIGLCGAVSYKRWKFLLPLVLCCVPCVFFALLYVVFK